MLLQGDKITIHPKTRRGNMPPKQLTLPGPITKKGNELARSRFHSGSAIGFRVAVMIGSVIRPTDDDFEEYEITTNILNDYNLSSSDQKRMERAMDDIAMTTVNIKRGTKYYAFPLFGKAMYDSATRKAYVSLNPNLKEDFLQLKNHFVRIPVMEFIRLRSVYTQKLYEYLLSWRSEPEHAIAISELHDLVGAIDGHRKDYGRFNAKVLKPAFKQINKETSLRYEYEPIKKGRKVVHVRFAFSQGKMAQMREAKNQLTPKQIEAQHQSFLDTFRDTPENILKDWGWLSNRKSDTYENSFKAFLKKEGK